MDKDLDLVVQDAIIVRMPQILADKIAAGEVVQRPAAVVKELMENALDAGATEVDVAVKASGMDLIQVVDNGSGMSSIDAERAFDRHATSKIRSIEDLDRLATLGFRGEALASIAAVSQVVLKTKTVQADHGHMVRINGGEIQTSEPCGTRTGSSITVRNLFYNVPARRQFLKSAATEQRHIVETFLQIALSHPSIAFSLTSNGVEQYALASQSGDDSNDLLRRRITDVFGSEVEQSLIELDEKTTYISISGFIGSPQFYRRTAGEQYFFVNGRSIRSRYLNHAVRKSMERLLPEKAYPFFVIHLDVDPSHVDVNVHPTKQEVKFDDDGGVYAIVRSVVRRALGQSGFVASPQDFGGKSIMLSEELHHMRDHKAGGNLGSATEALYGGESPVASGQLFVDHQPKLMEEGTNDFLWQVQDAYIVAPVRSGLLFVNQSRAHERILYEQTLANLNDGLALSQQLLFPETFELSPSLFRTVETIIPSLNRVGFDLDVFGGTSIVVRGVPESVRASSAKVILMEIVQDYIENDRLLDSSMTDKLARSVARKCAIRQGEKLGVAEMQGLMDQLLLCSEPAVCPLGRPTLFMMTESEISERLG